MDNSLLTVYPTTEANWHNENTRTEGLLLRDYFAAKAMQAFITGAMSDGTPFREKDAVTVSEVAFDMADAMLEARKK